MEQTTFAEVSSQPVESPAVESPQSEKHLPQSQVNELIGKVKSETYEKAFERGKREALESLVSNPVQQPNHTSQVAPSNTVSSNMPSIDEIKRIAAEGAQSHINSLLERQTHEMNMREGQRIAEQFNAKLETGKQDYEDYDTVVRKLPLDKMADIVLLADSVEGTADIMYRLASNPAAIGNIRNLLQIDPSLARDALAQIASDMRTNKEAKRAKQANEPLSRIQPSPIGTDSGAKTVSDFRKMFRGRK